MGHAQRRKPRFHNMWGALPQLLTIPSLFPDACIVMQSSEQAAKSTEVGKCGKKLLECICGECCGIGKPLPGKGNRHGCELSTSCSG
eukprot:4526540-Amphidinium_carterae.1